MDYFLFAGLFIFVYFVDFRRTKADSPPSVTRASAVLYIAGAGILLFILKRPESIKLTDLIYKVFPPQ